MNIRKILFITLLVALTGINAPAYSDDTEIYLDPGSDNAGQPLVLFTLDYRSNLNAQVCNGLVENDPNSSECFDLFEICEGEVIDPNTGDRTCTSTPHRDKIQQPTDYTNITFFEALRAVLRIVLADVSGFRLALMMNHNDTTTGQCGAGPIGPSDTECSNGGYVLLGFNGEGTGYDYDSSALSAGLDVEPATPDGDYDFEDHKERFHQILENIPAPQGNVAHPMQGKELYFEFFRYLSGQDVYNAHNGYDDYDSTEGTLNLDDPDQLPLPVGRSNIAWDTLIETGGQNINQPFIYKSPLYESCTKIFVINLMFAVSNAEDNSDDAITDTTPDSGAMEGIDLSGNNNNFSTVIRYLNRDANLTPSLDGSDSVISYFVVDDSQVQQANQKGYAGAGNTNTAIPMGNPVGLAKKLSEILFDIISISTTFVSATVPVNVFNRSESLSDVFFGIFQPESEKLWNGNVKRLNQLTALIGDPPTPTLIVADTRGVEAISSVDGRFSHGALTYWTRSTWPDVVAADTSIGEISGSDGRSVSRGGAGQKVQGHFSDAPTALNSGGGRRLFTQPNSATNGTPATLMDLEATNAQSLWVYLRDGIQDCGTCAITNWADAATALFSSDGISTTAQQAAANRITFARGIDIYDVDTDGARNDARPWLFGDILHSQPITINYGVLDDATYSGYTQANPNIRIMTASNDGYVRMLRHNTNVTPSLPATTDNSHLNAGEEVWAFMPREIMPVLGGLAENIVGDHPYALDGGLVLYVLDNNYDGTLNDSDTDGNRDKVWAFFGVRRGGQGFSYDATDTPSGNSLDSGKAYYALDLSDPDTPKLLWQISKSDTDFAELGQTWSTPRIVTLDWGSGPKPALIFAGGYDTKKDIDSNIVDGFDENDDGDILDAGDSTNADYVDTEGNAIFIVDASDGSLIWKAVRTGTASDSVHVNSSLKDSIPSDVTTVDSNNDNLVDRIYVGDTGGVVWRVDLPGTDSGDWAANAILSVGRHAVDGDGDSLDAADRRFFHAPDIVEAINEDGRRYFAVLTGSGNRAHPKDVYDADDINDRDEDEKDGFFVLKDFTLTTNPSDVATAGLVTVDDLAEFNAPSDAADAASATCGGDGVCTTDLRQDLKDHGWWIPLGINGDGEKILSSSITFEGNIYFTSYVPNIGLSTICGPKEGLSYTYVVNLTDGSPGFPSFGGWSIESGSGITSDPIVTVQPGLPAGDPDDPDNPPDPDPCENGGDVFILPGNLPTIEEFRKKAGCSPLERTFWYEEEL